ncbi:hypothetical protein HHI36_016903 [Cryptolaemus montrouzieri]|uniref:Uncharacterized protein n=1 Tax=Cryptolaemus montrouzieri TaxID=559131 RepID=A0ABD2NL36_9CUCU
MSRTSTILLKNVVCVLFDEDWDYNSFHFSFQFLSAVMTKEYENALKYCKLILQYEPNNSTAKEFYPVILEKLKQTEADKSDNNDSTNDSDTSSSSESDTSSNDDSSDGQEDDAEEEEEEEEDEEEIVVNLNQESNKGSKGSSNGDNTTGSYSSLEDDEAVMNQLEALTAKYKIDNVDSSNGNSIYDSSKGHSSPAKFSIKTDHFTNGEFLAPGNKYNFPTSSDSESPTEPVTQETIALLRSRVVPN